MGQRNLVGFPFERTRTETTDSHTLSVTRGLETRAHDDHPQSQTSQSGSRAHLRLHSASPEPRPCAREPQLTQSDSQRRTHPRARRDSRGLVLSACYFPPRASVSAAHTSSSATYITGTVSAARDFPSSPSFTEAHFQRARNSLLTSSPRPFSRPEKETRGGASEGPAGRDWARERERRERERDRERERERDRDRERERDTHRERDRERETEERERERERERQRCTFFSSVKNIKK
ncbi:hypothetical protein AOLI_G00272920 [Acnodon oligacanthus]